MKCDSCKIYAEMPLYSCCAWLLDEVICGDKTLEECPKYVPLETEKGGAER